MKRSRFTNLFSLFVACALIGLPATLGCGDGDSETGGDVATDEMGDGAEPGMDAGEGGMGAEMGGSEPAADEPAADEPAADEAAEGEPAANDAAEGEPEQN